MAAALLLTVIAGLATGLGGLAVFLTNRTNGSFLALSLGFSAGVMLYVSFVEIRIRPIRTSSPISPAMPNPTPRSQRPQPTPGCCAPAC